MCIFLRPLSFPAGEAGDGASIGLGWNDQLGRRPQPIMMQRRDAELKKKSIGQRSRASAEAAQLVSRRNFDGANWRVMAKGAIARWPASARRQGQQSRVSASDANANVTAQAAAAECCKYVHGLSAWQASLVLSC